MPAFAAADLPQGGFQNLDAMVAWIDERVSKAVAEAVNDNHRKGAELAANDPRSYMRLLLGGKDAAAGGARQDGPHAADIRGLRFAQVARALGVARGDVARAKAYVETAYKGVTSTRDAIIGALAEGVMTGEGLQFKALSSISFDDGGALVHGAFANEVIELLRPTARVRSANPQPIPLDMGTITVPRIAGGATAAYVGEGQNIAASQLETDDITLNAKQLASIVPVNAQLLQFASVDVDTMVRNDMVNAIAQKEDITFLASDGLNNTPRGLRYWAADSNIVTTAFANTLDGAIAFAVTMMTKLSDNFCRMLRPAWFITPTQRYALMTYRFTNGGFAFRDELAAGTWFGIPVFVLNDPAFKTAASGTANAALIDMADVLLGTASTLTIDASNTASYIGSDGQMKSAFARNQFVLRFIEQHDLGMRHRGSAAWATNVPFQASV